MGCHRSHFGRWQHSGWWTGLQRQLVPSGKDTAKRTFPWKPPIPVDYPMQIEIASMLDPSPSSLFLFLLLPLWPTHNTSIVAQKKMPQQKQQQHHQHPNRAPWSQFSYSRVAYTFSNLMNMVMHCCRAVLWWGGVCWRYSTVLSPSFSVSVNDRRWW